MLAALLKKRALPVDVVLGLTRGGVPVAYEVATALSARLDIIVIKKLGSPSSPELAIGAVCSDGVMVTREDAIADMDVDPEYVAREARQRAREARDAEARYRHGTPPAALAGARVVVVDDGIATGATMAAAVRSARSRGAAHVIVAAPVSSEHAERELSRVADALVMLGIPEMFWAVGQFYDDFSPVEDENVRELLARAHAEPRP